MFRWFSAFKADQSRLSARNVRQQIVYAVLFVVTLPLISIHYKK
jgi:hypothetical protein